MLSLDLVDKGLVTDQLVVTVGYDIENLTDPARKAKYHGAVVKDHYGRQIPKHAHGTINLDGHTSSTRKIMCAAAELFDCIVGKNILIRRLNVVANHVLPKESAPVKNGGFDSSTCLPTMPHNRRSRNGKSRNWSGSRKCRRLC